MGKTKNKTKGNRKFVEEGAIASDKHVIEVQEENLVNYNKDLETGKKNLEAINKQIKNSETMLGFQQKFVEYFKNDKNAFEIVNKDSALYGYQINPIFANLAFKMELHNRERAVDNTTELIKQNKEMLKKNQELMDKFVDQIKEAEEQIFMAKQRLKGNGVEL